MRVRTFSAATIPEAMSLVRAEMGEDAIILSSERLSHGVELRAAAERRPDRQAAAPGAPEDRLRRLEAELERRLVAAIAQPRPSPAALDEHWTAEAIARRLLFHEVPESLRQNICTICDRLGAPPGPDTLGQAIEELISFRPLPAEPELPLLLVGMPGSGKTACAAKLAVRSVLAGKPALLVSLDTSAGAASQIQTFAGVVGIQCIMVETPDDLEQTIAASVQTVRDHTVIIDTAGINPFDAQDRAHITALMTASGAEPILVSSAAGGGDLEDQTMLFRSMGVRRMLATRLDLTRRLGGLLQAAAASRLELAQASSSPYIAETMEPMNPYALARRLLTGSPA